MKTNTSDVPNVEVIDETIHHRSMGIDSFGRTVRYRLNMDWRVHFQVDGEKQEVLLQDSVAYAVDEETLLGSDRERDDLIDLLRSELAIDLLRHLALQK